MFFTNGGWSSLPRGWGAPIYKLEKTTIGKIKSKKYVQLEK